MSNPENLDTEELKYSIDISNDESNFEETQELEYPSSISSFISTDSSEDTDDEEIGEKLKPYDFEPSCKPRKEVFSDNESHNTNKSTSDCEDSPDSEAGDTTRKGNTTWCVCGHCHAMETEIESLCCRDTSEVPDDYFEGNQ